MVMVRENVLALTDRVLPGIKTPKGKKNGIFLLFFFFLSMHDEMYCFYLYIKLKIRRPGRLALRSDALLELVFNLFCFEALTLHSK